MTPTAQLTTFLRGLALDDVPIAVRESAGLAFANIVGVAVGGLDEPATQRAIAAARLLAPGASAARVPGGGAALSIDQAAFVLGVAAHVLDFDDTDLATILHPSAAPFGALLAIGDANGVDGRAALTAWIAGLECGLRVADGLGRSHYDRGWHVTGTAGAVAAAATGASLLGLVGDRYETALNIGATAAGGHRAHFGTDTKSGHAGFAAQRGVHAAFLAREGFTAAEDGLTGPRGLLGVLGPDGDHGALTRDLGMRWRLLDNRLKPYACGVVTHPVIDAGREASRLIAGDPGRLVRVELLVHPLVGELTSIADPATGLEGKFSVRHCFVAGLVRDKAGPDEFTDAFVRDPVLVRLRNVVEVRVEGSLRHMTARAVLHLADGTSRSISIDRPRGSDERPLTPAEAEAKFVELVGRRAGTKAARAWYARLTHLEREPSLAALVLEFDAAVARKAVTRYASDRGSDVRWT